MSDATASSMPEVVGASRQTTLLEVLDRLLDTGAVLKGKVLLSVADVDLVYLGLQMVLASVATLEGQAGLSGSTQDALEQPLPGTGAPVPGRSHAPEPLEQSRSHVPSTSTARNHRTEPSVPPVHRGAAATAAPQTTAPGSSQVQIDPEQVEKGLAKLVLTIVELLRRLMENQAVRRMERGTLSAEQVERLGKAFSKLEARMGDLKKVFGLEDEELNLDLGPIGKLL